MRINLNSIQKEIDKIARRPNDKGKELALNYILILMENALDLNRFIEELRSNLVLILANPAEINLAVRSRQPAFTNDTVTKDKRYLSFSTLIALNAFKEDGSKNAETLSLLGIILEDHRFSEEMYPELKSLPYGSKLIFDSAISYAVCKLDEQYKPLFDLINSLALAATKCYPDLALKCYDPYKNIRSIIKGKRVLNQLQNPTQIIELLQKATSDINTLSSSNGYVSLTLNRELNERDKVMATKIPGETQEILQQSIDRITQEISTSKDKRSTKNLEDIKLSLSYQQRMHMQSTGGSEQHNIEAGISEAGAPLYSASSSSIPEIHREEESKSEVIDPNEEAKKFLLAAKAYIENTDWNVGPQWTECKIETGKIVPAHVLKQWELIKMAERDPHPFYWEDYMKKFISIGIEKSKSSRFFSSKSSKAYSNLFKEHNVITKLETEFRTSKAPKTPSAQSSQQNLEPGVKGHVFIKSRFA